MVEVSQHEALAEVARDAGSNRRAAFRIDVSCPVHAVAERCDAGTENWAFDRRTGARTLRTVTEDVSMSGARIRLPAPLLVGSRLSLRFETSGVDVGVVAEVMHSRADEFGGYAGVHFVTIDPPTRAHLTRFVASEERRRLPNVRVMYAVTVVCDRERTSLEGSTQECTPTFVRVLLPRAVQPTASVTLIVSEGRTKIRLAGNVIGSQREGALWSTGVTLTRTDATTATYWADVLKHLRASR